MNLIVTRADDNIKDMCEITHPPLKKYAKKCNADFKIITCENSPPKSHYRIMQLKGLLNKYDRVLVLDSDMLVLKDCPNLFNIVPEDEIGVVFEDKGSRRTDRLRRIEKVQKEREYIGWTKDYINTGCFVVSKMHQPIFVQENLYDGLGYDDVELGYQIHKNDFKIFELNYAFNFMSMWLEPWCKADINKAFILHYAGKGFDPQLNRVDQLQKGFDILREHCLI